MTDDLLHQTASTQEITIINDILDNFPHLKRIIRPCDSNTILRFDQYAGYIPISRKNDICESKIYEVLLGSQVIKRWSYQLTNLERLLARYPDDYCNPEFGEQLVGAFFSHYREIEVYDDLKMCEYNPTIDPPIMPNLHNSKKADFKINQNGHDIFIEVITPRLPLNDELLFEEKPKAGFIGSGEREDIFFKIFNEYNHHFKPYEPQYKSPTLIILDKTDSLGISDAFGSHDLSKIYAKYDFPDYFIGILDRTRYNTDILYKILNMPRPVRFSLNPSYVDHHTLLPGLSRNFIHNKAISE